MRATWLGFALLGCACGSELPTSEQFFEVRVETTVDQADLRAEAATELTARQSKPNQDVVRAILQMIASKILDGYEEGQTQTFFLKPYNPTPQEKMSLDEAGFYSVGVIVVEVVVTKQ